MAKRAGFVYGHLFSRTFGFRSSVALELYEYVGYIILIEARRCASGAVEVGASGYRTFSHYRNAHQGTSLL
jgi:hypothetical protein